jgi:CMP-N,N'-diacetyllegionaminic acid synthase
MQLRILGFIPARGGSKGLPGKNTLPLCGKPLVAWTIQQAQRSRYLTEVIISTDSPGIARVAEEHGLPVPFLRPDELARDDSPVSDAVLHTLAWLEERGRRFDILALLEPTSPLRKEGDIDGAIELFLSRYEEADALVSVGKVHLESPYYMKEIRDGFVQPFLPAEKVHYHRQQLKKVYFPYGVIYMSKVDAFRKTRTFYQDRTIAYPIERWQNYEIDDLHDMICVSAIMEQEMQGR